MAIAALRRGPAPRLHCPEDDWDFDPRYTDWACPICGWRPDEAAIPETPAWQRELARVPWDLVGLGVLFLVLLVLAVLVGMAAKINILPS